MEKEEIQPAAGSMTSKDLEKRGPYTHGSAADSHDDIEKQLDQSNGQQPELKRLLKSRHLQMIAIGGTIGTGLFIGSGSALSTAGPVGALIAYLFIGTIVYSVMVSLGEMASYMPVTGAFTSYATRFIDPSLGFSMGWIYWFSWAITYPLELTTSGIIIQYWRPDLSVGIWIGVFWLVFTSLNFLPVKFYGEIEFWFATIKVITILGFMIFAICVDAGVGKQPYLGFHNWVHPGPFSEYLVSGATGKFVGFWAVLIKAAFAYQGTELVGIAAGETENPRKTIPSAIRKTFFRILFLFCLTIFFIGLIVPADNEQLLTDSSDASASPLVIAAKLAGVQVLPSIINVVLLTAVLSAANSNVYSGSRIICGLVSEGFAPRFMARANKHGVPYYAVSFTAAFGLLGFMNLSNNGGTVFDWFLNITAVAGLIAWSCIVGCHLQFMKALRLQNISRDNLPYKAPLQPWLAWYGLFFIILVIFTQGFTAFIPWNTSDFFVAYISLILFAILYVGHKVVTRAPLVNVKDIDVRGRQVEETEVYATTAPPTTVWGRATAWLH